MRRIEVAVVLTVGVLTAPLAAGRSSRGQCRTSACWSGSQHLIRLPRPFRSGMRELGYVEGRTIAIEWRYADALYTRAVELGKHRRRGVPRAARSRG